MAKGTITTVHPTTASLAGFEAVVALHWNKLLGIAMAKTNRNDGYDIVQDVLMAAWEKWDTLPANEELEYYLLHALKLRIFNYYRTTGRYHAHLQKLEAMLNDTVEEAEAMAEEELLEFREALIEEAIGHLTPGQQELFTLRIRHRYSYHQIAEVLNIEPASARVMYARALDQVKTYIRSNPRLSARLMTALVLFTIR